MGKFTIPLFIALIVVGLAVGYMFYSQGAHSNCNKYILGTWTTESGDEKFEIKNGSVIYSSESYGVEAPKSYVVTEFYFKEEVLDYAVWKPAKENESGLLGLYEEIRYRDGSLFGGIMVHDMGFLETEFRKNWQIEPGE